MTLKTQTIRGIKWTSLARGSQQILQIVITVVLARLLAPEDFGILAMAVVFTGLIAVFNDFGIGSAVIQNQELTKEELSSIFWFSVCIGLIATLFTVAISPLIAKFYQKDILVPVISLMSLGFFFTACSTIQQSILMKEMNFKKIAYIEICATFIGGVVAITLAYRGCGVWSLAWQSITSILITTTLLWLGSRWVPSLTFKFRDMGAILRFSLNLMGFRVFDYFSSNVDYLLIGRFLGAEALGYYTLAYRLMLTPLENMSRVVARVLFPAFSSIQQDDERFRNAYLRSTKFIAFVSFPVLLGLFAVADELVVTLFGPSWEPAVFLIKILCIAGVFQSIGSTVGQIYLAKGKTDWMFGWSLISTVVFVGAIFLGISWGLHGVAVAYTIAALMLVYPNFAIPFRLIGLKVITLALMIKTEFITTLLMLAVVLLSGVILRIMSLEPGVILASNVFLGAVTYLLATKYINTDIYNEIHGMLWKKSG